MATHLTWSDEVGKRVGPVTGRDPERSRATVRRSRRRCASEDVLGVNVGQRESAAQLVDYFMEEAKVLYVVYGLWMAGFEDWLRGEGVGEAELTGELDRLRVLMAWPDRTPLDIAARWAALGEAAGAVGSGIRSYELSVADGEVAVEALLADWRRLHDRYADLMAGLLAFVVRRFGEAALESCYRSVLEPYIQERYMVFDVRYRPYADTLLRNLYISLEAMRCHLVGPDRRGTSTSRSSTTAGSCATTHAGPAGASCAVTTSKARGRGSWRRTSSASEHHPWAWNEVGVCYYCATATWRCPPCAATGATVRTVDPPLWRGEDDRADAQAVHLDRLEDARGHP